MQPGEHRRIEELGRELRVARHDLERAIEVRPLELDVVYAGVMSELRGHPLRADAEVRRVARERRERTRARVLAPRAPLLRPFVGARLLDPPEVEGDDVAATVRAGEHVLDALLDAAREELEGEARRQVRRERRVEAGEAESKRAREPAELLRARQLAAETAQVRRAEDDRETGRREERQEDDALG